MPLLTASEAISLELKRESGTRLSLGSSHASAFTSTSTRGGKDGRTSPPWPILKSGKAFLVKAFSPLRDDLARQIELVCNLVIVQVSRREKDDLGPHDGIIRRCIPPRNRLKIRLLIRPQLDHIRALPWHTLLHMEEIISCQYDTISRDIRHCVYERQY
jgi:hypothetical protein